MTTETPFAQLMLAAWAFVADEVPRVMREGAPEQVTTLHNAIGMGMVPRLVLTMGKPEGEVRLVMVNDLGDEVVEVLRFHGTTGQPPAPGH